ncbi:DUF444 family protein [Candidatus Woesearchaeota archaeon]|nr:DUF444 family protein [Candidatus Woesearchaeota archaeon]
MMQGVPPPKPSAQYAFQTLDELLERDKKREEDGFPTKIKLGKIVKPGKGKKGKIVVVPTTTEDKFVHDDRFGLGGMGDGEGGTGEGEEGDVIAEQPLDGEGEEGGEGAGDGDGGDHEIESKAYELGRILTERFELPNLKEKGKKKAVKQYTYDLTDKHRGHGQILDKKATLQKIIETNMGLGNIKGDEEEIDTTSLVVGPRDKIYRILSRETEYQSEAVVFLLRDYSGSMWGKPTEVVCTQHLFIYAWLLYQYQKLVTPRFVVHDTKAKEVPDFHTYYTLLVAGGTDVHTAFKKVNEIVEKENLARDYNIYVFYGGDGQDWDESGGKTIEELEKIMRYANRVGITVAGYSSYKSGLERYIERSGLLDKHPHLFKMNSITAESATEERIIESIIDLIS